jgi:HSP20 family protein
MAITLWKEEKNPMALLDTLKKEMDRWFGDFFRTGDSMKTESFFDDAGLGRYPAVDIEERDNSYIVRAEIPGMQKDDIHVEYNDGYLTIRGEKKFEHEEKKKNFHRIERSYGSFRRSVAIPEEITEEAIKGEYKNGVLELKLPIREPEKRKVKKIKID